MICNIFTSEVFWVAVTAAASWVAVFFAFKSMREQRNGNNTMIESNRQIASVQILQFILPNLKV